MTFAYKFGPRIEGDHVRFRLWTPSADHVAVELESGETADLEPRAEGWSEAVLRCTTGTRYRFRIGDTHFPDPASRLQSGGVHGWSVVCPPASPPAWRGRPWPETILYELHPGLFGGFDGVAKALPRIAELGVTAIELMPIAAFPGNRNWGYDGVLPFAPAKAYGSPARLRDLIARAHEHDLMIFLDVVYNHFGPDGNYLALYAKPFFKHGTATPWGEAIDFQQPMVRQFFLENAHYWIHEFGFDGLRFDAVHAIHDEGWLPKLAASLRRDASERSIHLVVENDDNDASYLHRGFDAQWNDDLHHTLHVLLTGERTGYYRDFAETPARKLARALAEGFVYQGEVSANRGGKPRGFPSADLPPTAFVSFLQNHDQTGNRALGERLTVLAEPAALRAAIALLLLLPQIPLIFMGEETGSKAPFHYFTDHNVELARAIREGRSREFGAFFEAQNGVHLPDPNIEATYEESNPFGDGAASANSWTVLYRRLLRLRHTHIIPHLTDIRSTGARALGEKTVIAQWQIGNHKLLTIGCNLGNMPVPADIPHMAPFWGTAAGGVLPPCDTSAWLTDR